MIELITRPWNKLVGSVKLHIKQWTKPVTTGLVTGILSDTTRSRPDLIAENALLRQQLIVLKRQIKRPQLAPGDRTRLVLLARCTQFWQQALHIVQPDTLLRWYWDLFRLCWPKMLFRPGSVPDDIVLCCDHGLQTVAGKAVYWLLSMTSGDKTRLPRSSGLTASSPVDKVREPFARTARGCRMGLGLAVAHAIVAQHGGHIEVTGRPGRGTTFAIHLPARKASSDGTVDLA
jgi:hypothetical protein